MTGWQLSLSLLIYFMLLGCGMSIWVDSSMLKESNYDDDMDAEHKAAYRKQLIISLSVFGVCAGIMLIVVSTGSDCGVRSNTANQTEVYNLIGQQQAAAEAAACSNLQRDNSESDVDCGG
eukprot:COSAG05_NODE_6749_length_909_cov_0.928395_1_plen_119_part_10